MTAGKVVGKAPEGSAGTMSEFCFQHTALFVGDITWSFSLPSASLFGLEFLRIELQTHPDI